MIFFVLFFRDTGDPEVARKVTTNPVPRVNISGRHDDHLSSLDKHNYELDPGQHVFKSPLVVKESTIAGESQNGLFRVFGTSVEVDCLSVRLAF